MKTHNFSAGPCILPDEVFKNLTVIRFNKDNAYAVLELQGTTSLRYFNFKTGKKYQTSMLLYFLVF